MFATLDMRSSTSEIVLFDDENRKKENVKLEEDVFLLAAWTYRSPPH